MRGGGGRRGLGETGVWRLEQTLLLASTARVDLAATDPLIVLLRKFHAIVQASYPGAA